FRPAPTQKENRLIESPASSDSSRTAPDVWVEKQPRALSWGLLHIESTDSKSNRHSQHFKDPFFEDKLATLVNIVCKIQTIKNLQGTQWIASMRCRPSLAS